MIVIQRPSESALDFGKPVVLSSPFTFLFKCVVPVFCLTIGTSFLLSAAVLGGAPAGFYIVVVAGLCVTSVANWRRDVPLKKVTVDKNFLHVSNYQRQIAIPLTIVRTATKTGSWFWSPWPPFRVIVTFNQETAFGSRIVFIPGYYVEDVLRDLKEAVWSRHQIGLKGQSAGQPKPSCGV